MAAKIVNEVYDISSTKLFYLGALTVSLLFFFLYLTLSNNNLNNTNNFSAKFSFIDGISEDTKVVISGIEIGHVTSIEMLDNFEILIKGSLISDLKIPKDSSLIASTIGIFGKKYLSIIPGYDDHFESDNFNFIYTGDSYTIDYLGRYLENKINE